MNITGGYDVTVLDRDHAVYEAHVPLDPANPDPDATTTEEFDLGTTTTHTTYIRYATRWSRWLDSYAQYTRRWIHNPLFAVHEPNGVTNSSLPTDEDLVQFGGSWLPSHDVMLTGWFGVENRYHTSGTADFTEDNYPIVTSLSYLPSPVWSLSLSYAYFSNWIDQNIILGDQIGGFQGAGPTGRIELVPVGEVFDYGGRSHVIGVNNTYQIHPHVQLLGGWEYVHSIDAFDSPTNWPDLDSFSRVDVNTQRITTGVDWKPYDGKNLNIYFRYIYFDYDDASAAINSGTANMFLTGLMLVH